MERGLEITRRTLMTLTYRGHAYEQHKTAVIKKGQTLTYRGKQYNR